MVALDKYIKIIRAKGKSYFTKDQTLKDLQIKNDSLKDQELIGLFNSNQLVFA